jgi:hypothetical protein
MAKQIIVLDVDGISRGGEITVHYLLWLTTALPVAKPGIQSQWSGASGAEVAALAAGTTIEEGYSRSFPISYTTAQIKAYLNAHFASRQNFLTGAPQPGEFFGVFYDSGTLWSA